jgi:hypothetical protein
MVEVGGDDTKATSGVTPSPACAPVRSPTMAGTTSDFTVAPAAGGQIPYALVGPDGEPVEPVQDYLAALLAADCSPLTLGSYAFDPG